MAGDAPAMRVAGEWIRFDQPKCTPEELQELVRLDVLRPGGDGRNCNPSGSWIFRAAYPKSGRVRCNVHFQRDNLAIVCRLVWPTIPDPRTLGIPKPCHCGGGSGTGLVLLVSGPTGSGKSTTMAAIVEYINRNRAAHVITIEDPIEFIYTNCRSIIEQREIGSDTPSWHSAMRTVLH